MLQKTFPMSFNISSNRFSFKIRQVKNKLRDELVKNSKFCDNFDSFSSKNKV